MEKKVEIEVKKTAIVHTFYCDNCNKELGESREYDDGYYEKRGVFEEKMYLHDGTGWVSIQGHLCSECKKLVCDAIKNGLQNISKEFNLTIGGFDDED